MTAKVTLSFSEETISDARELARRDGVSLSAWMDRAARERSLREIFTAHAEAVRRAGLDDEAMALADEKEIGMVDAEIYGETEDLHVKGSQAKQRKATNSGRSSGTDRGSARRATR